MDIEEKAVYIILMMNVSPVDRKFHHRVYDIKGSEFNRSTVQEKKIKDQRQLSKVTLKDMDFKEFEGRITLTSDRSSFVRKTLRKDVDFLSTMGVMDYSVLIIKRGG
jgi:1-phosphatidylinositol-4-phosphate 5-kinase